MSWKRVLVNYFDLNQRYQEAVLRRAQRQDPEETAASGDAGSDMERSPFSFYHQLVMFVTTFAGVLIQNSVSQYVKSEPIILSLPSLFQLFFYGALSLALMPFIYARFAKIPPPPMIVQIGWGVAYGFFSRPALAALGDVVVATFKLLPIG